MIDKKWLRYQATLLSKKSGLGFDKAYEQVINDPQLGKADEYLQCPACGVRAKGKNFSSHLKNIYLPQKSNGKIFRLSNNKRKTRSDWPNLLESQKHESYQVVYRALVNENNSKRIFLPEVEGSYLLHLCQISFFL